MAFWLELMGVLAACGAAGGLRELRLHTLYLGGFTLPGWTAAVLCGVHAVHIQVDDGELLVDVLLASVDSLEELQLKCSPSPVGGGLSFGSAASLPRQLTKLHIEGTMWADDTPSTFMPQVARLPRLRELAAAMLDDDEGWDGLTNLSGSLERLLLNYCSWLPPPTKLEALGHLTMVSLENFGMDRLESSVEGELEDAVLVALEAALPAVAQLQALRVLFGGCGYYVVHPSLPRALADLSHL